MNALDSFDDDPEQSNVQTYATSIRGLQLGNLIALPGSYIASVVSVGSDTVLVRPHLINGTMLSLSFKQLLEEGWQILLPTPLRE